MSHEEHICKILIGDKKKVRKAKSYAALQFCSRLTNTNKLTFESYAVFSFCSLTLSLWLLNYFIVLCGKGRGQVKAL